MSEAPVGTGTGITANDCRTGTDVATVPDDRSLAPTGPGAPSMTNRSCFPLAHVGRRSTFDHRRIRGSASLIDPGLNLCQIPDHAARSQMETSRKLTAPLLLDAGQPLHHSKIAEGASERARPADGYTARAMQLRLSAFSAARALSIASIRNARWGSCREIDPVAREDQARIRDMVHVEHNRRGNICCIGPRDA